MQTRPTFLYRSSKLLLSHTVSEIMVNAHSSVWIEEGWTRVRLHRVHFEEGVLGTGLEVIANRFGKKLDADNPNSDRRNFGF
jgi:pilus assembly protein CpaF